MDKILDETRSREVAAQIKSKSRAPFDNAYRAALAVAGATYVQGFLVRLGNAGKPVEHAWVEVEDRIVDPNLPYLNAKATQLYYFPAQRLTVKKLKAAIEEAQEDYPDDDPLPIYGSTPYAYYGDVMLGGQEYVDAYQCAETTYQDLIKRNAQNN